MLRTLLDLLIFEAIFGTILTFKEVQFFQKLFGVEIIAIAF